jgi:serine/threonine protein kinase
MQALLPQYYFESLVGRGGMGAVYRAVQISLDRPVAIKVLPGDLMDDADVNFTERFKNEARTMAKMNHPGIVNVFDFGEAAGGLLYIVMEFVDGTDVAKMISTQGRLPAEHALAITAHVCDALTYAHRHGIIHRDIKPANIMVNMEGAVKVADFGLAKANDANQSGLTKTNMAMGTPDFVAPEALIAGMTVDGRADLYAIGVMLYQMLTGNIPRGMWTMPSIMVQTDPRFDAIISRAMQTDREARYQDAGDIRRDLDVILTVPMVKDAPPPQSAPQQQSGAPALKPQSKGQPKPHQPAAAPHHVSAPPGKKLNFGMIAGVTATIILGIGLFSIFKPKSEPVVEAPAPSAAPVSNSSSAPAPASSPPSPEPIATPAATMTAPVATGGTRRPPPVGGGWVDGLDTWWKNPRNDHFQQGPGGVGRVTPGRSIADMMPRSAELIRPMRDMSVSLTVLGEEWGLDFHKDAPDKEGDQFAYGIQVKRKYPDLVLGFANVGKSFGSFARFPWPPDMDWSVPHTLGLQTRGDTFTIHLDGVKMGEAKDARISSGYVQAIAHEGSVIEGFYFREAKEEAAPPVSPSPLAMSASAPVSKPVTGPVNLLENLDTTRQALAGRWFMQGGALLVDASNVTTTAFEFEHLAPEEYDYEIEFSSASTAPDMIQILPAPGAHWFLVRHNWQIGALIGNYLDGVVGNDPARTQGVARQFKIAKGRRYKSVVKVRRDSVLVELDGMPIITWRGELSRLSTQGDLKMRDVRHPGLSTVGADMIIHKAEIRPPSDEKSKAASEDHPALANARVKQLTSGFKSRLDSDALNPYRDALAKLNQSYITNGIAKARAAAQSGGDLNTVNALDAEKTLLETGGEVPEVDSVDAPAALTGLRATYRGALQKIISDRDEKAAPLYDIYLRALDALTDELTRANKIDEARQVKSLRDETAAQRPQTAVASVNKSPAKAGNGTAATTAAPAKAAPSGGSPWRTAANFLLSNGGSFVCLKNGAPTQVLKADDIPAGKFDITEMALDRAGSLLPPLTTEQMRALNGLRDLRRVWVRPNAPGITDQAFAFLAGNDDLNWINLEGVPEVTDAVLPFLAEAKKLDCLLIQYATKFTGTGLDRLAFVNSLTRLDVLGCGITDEGMQAISACKKLLYLRITSTALSDACGPHLRKLKTLADVSLNGTGVGDGTCGFIATLTDLTALDLGNTKVTNVGLQKLKALRKLASLSLANTAVTLQEAAAFQDAMPQCRVTR